MTAAVRSPPVPTATARYNSHTRNVDAHSNGIPDPTTSDPHIPTEKSPTRTPGEPHELMGDLTDGLARGVVIDVRLEAPGVEPYSGATLWCSQVENVGHSHVADD